MQLLLRWSDYRLINIVAPAGFGKSTLAALWLRDIGQSPEAERPLSVWFSLENDDDSADVLAQHFAARFGTTFPAVNSVAYLHKSGDASAQQVMRTICDEISGSSRHVIIVLDDLHVLETPESLALIQLMLKLAGSLLHLVVLSRTQHSLDLGRLLLEDRVLTFGHADLSFDHAEFVTFVQHSRLAALNSEQLTALEPHVAGWAAGLQLLAQALPASTSAESSQFLLQAEHSNLTAFLEQEVMRGMPAPMRKFLVETSFLPMLYVDLCEAVTQVPHAECVQLLDLAITSNQLIIQFTPSSSAPSDATRYFRVHPILRSFLQNQLRQTCDAEAIRMLRHRACSWLAAHGRVDAALVMLSGAQSATLAAHSEQDAEFAADLVLAAGATALANDDVVRFQHWLQMLQEAAIRTRPRLVFTANWLQFRNMSPRRAAQVERMRATLTSAEMRHDPQLPAYRSEAAVVNALDALGTGRLDLALQHYESIDVDLIPTNSIANGYRYIIKAFVDPSESPTLDNRLQEVAQARTIFYQLGFPRGHLISMYVEAWIRQACADSKNVLTMYEAAVGFFRSNRIQFTFQNVLTHTLYGDLLYFHDKIQEARIVLQQAAEISQQLEKPADSVVYHATLRLQLCDLASGVRPQIEDKTDEQQWRQFTSVTPLASNITYLRILRDIKLGRLDRVRHTLGSFGSPAGGDNANTPLVQRISLLTYEVHANPNFDLVESMLRDFDEYCVRLGWTAFSMQARVLRLVHSLKLDAQTWDLQLLDALLIQIESTGLHRYVLDFPQLAPLLRMSTLPFADVLLQKVAEHSHLQPADSFGLSRQEIQVLRRIADGRSTNEIALDLQISSGTVRTHVRNAFLKMNVHHRAEAIKVARDAGLFDASA
jgi:ATP/maltotriose-dependent transcriptional regulator MalT